MGWNEADEEEYVITEDDMKEFQNLTKQVNFHGRALSILKRSTMKCGWAWFEFILGQCKPQPAFLKFTSSNNSYNLQRSTLITTKEYELLSVKGEEERITSCFT